MQRDLIKFREYATPEIIELLDNIEYGTNGAIYKHLDTRDRIAEIDTPLFLSLEQGARIMANLTFCRRDQGWYIRFFGFTRGLRAGKHTTRANSSSLLRKELKKVFNDLLEQDRDGYSTEVLYAYIDPQNDRSQLIRKDFGFERHTTLITQTFSRVYPKKSSRLVRIEDYNEVKELFLSRYADQLFFHDHHIKQGPFHGLRDRNGKILSFIHTTEVHWIIRQLPGKFGKPLVKLVPFIPFLNRLLKPSQHTFLAADALWIKDNDPKLLEELFSAILAERKLNMIIWWSDEKDPASSSLRNKVKWGLLDQLVGRTPVDVVVRAKEGHAPDKNKPVFVSAFDMV